jgi:hypothetical protein
VTHVLLPSWCLPRRAYGVEVVGAGLSGGGGELTGIDYLGLIAVAYRRQWHRRLRLVDPTGAAASVPSWRQVTVITAGRLLTTPSG